MAVRAMQVVLGDGTRGSAVSSIVRSYRAVPQPDTSTSRATGAAVYVLAQTLIELVACHYKF